MNDFLRPIRDGLGVSAPELPARFAEDFHEQVAAVLEAEVPVFSFTFGTPDEDVLREFREHHVTLMGTATTVAEAEQLQAAGVDVIVVQGSEAGGHRGTFLGEFAKAMVGTLALVPQVVNRVRVPVVAAGGVMDGRGIVACLALGAAGVQMGTAFLTCTESGAHALHKQAVLTARDDSTVVTNGFSGKPARGIDNAFIQRMADYRGSVPVYPVQNTLTKSIRRAAAEHGRSDYLSLWAGQAAGLARETSATELIEQLVAQTNHVIRGLAGDAFRG